METHGFAALLFTTLLLGLAHGIDWDHIAAITDITGTVDEWRPGFYLASLYALGHALVVVILGVVAILAGLALPEWVDEIMAPAVGITLIFLAVWIVYSLFHHHTSSSCAAAGCSFSIPSAQRRPGPNTA